MEKKSLITGIGIGIVAIFCLWFFIGSNGRYQISSGQGIFVIDTRTGEVWGRGDSPNGWVGLGKPNK